MLDGRLYLTFWVSATTTWSPSSDMPAGSYQWWVQAWGPNMGLGAWSVAASYSIDLQRPGAITQIAPIGAQSSHNLIFRWQKDPRATWYRIWVGRGGVTFHDRWYERSGTGEASVTINNHPAGDFAWYIQPWGPDGFGPWSGPRNFSTPSAHPATPVLISPSGQTSSRRPAFRWEQSARAEWYRISIQNRSTGRTVVDQWVRNTSAGVSTDLAIGNYRWWAGAWNDTTKTTVWSAPLDFTVGTPGYLYNVALTWGASPRDLNAHLLIPNGSHVHAGSKGSRTTAPFAHLHVESATGRGPENIAIYQAYGGIYRYYVYNASADSDLAGSGARVRVMNADGGVVFDRTVPATGSGRYWYVFDLTHQTGQITVRNQLQTTAP